MRVMLDTNIFVSAVLFPKGVVSRALTKALLPPYQPVVCDYVLEELKRIFIEKFPERTTELGEFLRWALPVFEVVDTPDCTCGEELFIRDENDRSILRAALANDVDILLTGDKDFLESSVIYPKIISVNTFLEY